MISQSLLEEGRPFGFLQLQHFIFNVLTPEHPETVGHYNPFVEAAFPTDACFTGRNPLGYRPPAPETQQSIQEFLSIEKAA